MRPGAPPPPPPPPKNGPALIPAAPDVDGPASAPPTPPSPLSTPFPWPPGALAGEDGKPSLAAEPGSTEPPPPPPPPPFAVTAAPAATIRLCASSRIAPPLP